MPLETQGPRDRQVLKAKLALPEIPVLPDLKVKWDQPGLLEPRATQDLPAHRVMLAQQDRRAKLEIQGQQGQQGHKEKLVQPGPLATLVKLAQRDQPEQPANKDPLVPLEQRESKEQQAPLVPPEQRGLPERQVLLGLKVHSVESLLTTHLMMIRDKPTQDRAVSSSTMHR